jgi:hypothetical protein
MIKIRSFITTGVAGMRRTQSLILNFYNNAAGFLKLILHDEKTVAG